MINKTNFIIDLSNAKLDNAQYIMLYISENFNINSNSSNNKKNIDRTDDYGVLLGSYSSEEGEFNFYISGNPVITQVDGVSVEDSEKLKQYLIQDKEETLQYHSMAYIQVVNVTKPMEFYGVFFSVGDALKCINEKSV